jgi:hypothetical protein
MSEVPNQKSGPLMPKATAIWLIENTSLTFEQIADFCQLHVLEVQGIADGDVAQSMRGVDPIITGQTTPQAIEEAQQDPKKRLELLIPQRVILESKKGGRRPGRRTSHYIPMARRQDRPKAILWLQRNYPELKDAQIMRLVSTTKATIQKIRERTHWDSAHLTPTDPVFLGLCSQEALDQEVAQVRQERPMTSGETEGQGLTLISAAHIGPEEHKEEHRTSSSNRGETDVDLIFARLKERKENGSGARDTDSSNDSEES